MTIREAIDRLDRLTPNQYDNEEKVRWLSELDGVAHREILTRSITSLHPAISAG